MKRRLCLLLVSGPLTASWLLAGCGDDSGGGSGGGVAVQVLLASDPSVTDGLDSGEGPESVRDGWTVRFDQYVATVGQIAIGRSANGAERADATVHVADLAALPVTGFELSGFDNVAAGRWDQFGYRTPDPTRQALRAEEVPQADYDEMVASGCTFLLAGEIMKSGGESCPLGGSCVAADQITFRFCVPANTEYRNCASEDDQNQLPGLAVRADGVTTANVTLHGDHIFFNAFPTASETIERRAQWLANADSDGDAETTQAELMALDAAELFPSSDYSLTGSPIAIETGWDFVRAQTHTQGHFQGEGECVWVVDPDA